MTRLYHIGAAERAGPCGAEDGGTGPSPMTAAAVHPMRAIAHPPRPVAGRTIPAGVTGLGPTSSLTAATCAANSPAGPQRSAGLSWGGAIGATVIDLWPVWLAIVPALLIEFAV